MEEKKKFDLNGISWRKFFLLPFWLRMLVTGGCSLLVLMVVFFMVGSYLYSPQKTARDYYEAQLSGDWNRMYDCCLFPEGTFLSRKNFVNAKSYGEEDGKELPKIKNYRMRKTGTNEKTESGIYQITCTLEEISEVQNLTLEIAGGADVLGPFREWYIVPENLYVKDVEFVIPEGAQLYLDGIRITETYAQGSEDAETTQEDTSIYCIPYLFLGYHTVQIQETGRDEYREIIQIKDDRAVEILPELKLNDANGKKIADLVEDAVQSFCEAGMKKQEFSKVSDYFLEDAAVQKKAEKALEEFSAKAADENSTGLAKLAVTAMETTVSSRDGTMEAEVTVSYTAEKVEKRLFFFYRTVTESGNKTLRIQMKSSQGEWKIQSWS